MVRVLRVLGYIVIIFLTTKATELKIKVPSQIFLSSNEFKMVAILSYDVIVFPMNKNLFCFAIAILHIYVNIIRYFDKQKVFE